MSSPITLSGFNNIDFSSVLNALMAQERIPVTQLTTQRTALTNQKNFFSQYAAKLASLDSAVDALTAANAFDGRSATVSDPTAASVSRRRSTRIRDCTNSSAFSGKSIGSTAAPAESWSSRETLPRSSI